MSTINADTARDAASEGLDQLQRAAAPALKRTTRQAGMLLEQSGELIDSVGTDLSEKASQLGDSLISYTKKNPLIALLLAVGAGALLISVAKSRR